MRTRNHLPSRNLRQISDNGLWSGSLLLCCALVVTSALAVGVYGQSYQGGLRGAVHDSTGAVIFGANLTLTNEETNATRTTLTNSDGEYSFANVLPGTYSLTTSQAGFKKSEHKGIRIGTQEFITLDLSLEAGPTGRGGLLATAMRVVNAIPVVCEAKPGLVTALDLPIAPRRGLVRP